MSESLINAHTIIDDKILAGQLRTKLIIDMTQALIATTVMIGYIGMIVYSQWSSKPYAVPESLTNTMFLVVGFYFSRASSNTVNGLKSK